MSWLNEWQALSSRIQGLINAGTFFFRAQHTSSADDREVKRKILLKVAQEILTNLNSFKENYKSILPIVACESLDRFLGDVKRLPAYDVISNGLVSGDVQFALTSLAAFCSEFSYLISDSQAIARRVTERAFIHLQRSIMVDSDIRQKWCRAFKEEGEPTCEQLGAVHLLSHGIWAFKVDAKGGRTDLVLNESLPSFSKIESVADALVLTEWKLVKTKVELDGKIQLARKQADIYSAGVLGGIEIANYRYLVMVSERMMEMPGNEINGTI